VRVAPDTAPGEIAGVLASVREKTHEDQIRAALALEPAEAEEKLVRAMRG
jgi:hypothetical protein